MMDFGPDSYLDDLNKLLAAHGYPYKMGDLVLDKREHRPRVGKIVGWQECGPRRVLEIGFDANFNYGMLGRPEFTWDKVGAVFEYGGLVWRDVPLEFLQIYDGDPTNFGKRVDRPIIENDVIPRLDDGMAVYSLYSEGRETFWEVDDKYKEFMRSKWDSDFDKYEIKELEKENERRKLANAAWNRGCDGIVTLFVALGASVGIYDRLEPGAPKEIYLKITIPEALEDEFTALLSEMKLSYEDGSIERFLPIGEQWKSEHGDFYPNGLEAAIKYHGAEPPRDGETAAEFAKRTGVTEDRFRQIVSAWRASNGNTLVFQARIARIAGSAGASPEGQRFVVAGLFPRKAVGLMVSPGGSGKSTFVTQACAHISAGDPLFGLPVEQGGVVYLTGEDDKDTVHRRRRAMETVLPQSLDFMVFDTQEIPTMEILSDTVADIGNVSIIVIDTVSVLCHRTNDTAPVREFMQACYDIAVRNDCFVLGIHHTNKNTSSRTSRSVVSGTKGSNEFTNAARIVLTFHVEDQHRVLSVVKSNFAASVPQLTAPIRFSYDPATELFTPDEPPVLSAPADRSATASSADRREGRAASPAPAAPVADPLADAAVLAPIIDSAKKDGRRIALSGENEPFNLKAPPVKGWSRARVRAAHRAAIDAGLLSEG